jgi:glucokinase
LSRLAAGVDVGGTKVLGVAVDPAEPSKVVAEHRVPTPRGADAVLDAVVEVVKSLESGGSGAPQQPRGQADGPVDIDVVSVGLGIAGLVDRSGMLHTSPNLPTLLDVSLRSELGRRLGLPVTVDNDATSAAWGEHEAGAARGATDSITVALGTGIGAGLVSGGQLVRGAHGFGGEAGHMIVDPSGPLCPCGRRGCWERFASGSGLGRMARDAAEAGRLEVALELADGDVAQLRGEHVAAAAHRGDGEARGLLHDFAWWVALGIANLVTLLDSGVVVVAGGLIEIGEPLMGPVLEHYDDLVMSHDDRSDVRIVAAELGERAGAIGAALLGAIDGETAS